MRGHWISTTRKLNKHYQSAAPRDEWGTFYLGNVPQPYGWLHVAQGQSEWNDDTCFYNKVMSPWNSTTNYAQGTFAAGYRLKKLYDCAFMNAPTVDLTSQGLGSYAGSNNSTINSNERMFYYDDPSKALGPKGHNIMNSARNVNIYKDLGIRYLRYHMPIYGYGPAYVWDNPHSLLQPEAGDEFMQTKVPVYNGVTLSAKATKACAMLSSYNQRTIITEEYTRSGRTYTRTHQFIGTQSSYNNQNYSPYDLELAGQSLILGPGTTFSVYENGEYGTTIDVKFGLYIFFYNGDMYMDLVPHTFDPDTMEEIDTGGTFYLSDCRYPMSINGYMTRGQYVQPVQSGIYPKAWYRSVSGTAPVGSGVAPAFFTLHEGRWQFYNDQIAEPGWKYQDLTPQCSYLMFYPVEEEDFWNAEDAWHRIHGGTSYLTIQAQRDNIS